MAFSSYSTGDHIIFTDGRRTRAILRVTLAVDAKICGVTFIQILFLLLKFVFWTLLPHNPKKNTVRPLWYLY